MRKMISGAVLLTLLSQLLVIFPASAERSFDDPPPSDQIFLDVVAVYGSGCVPGTSFVAMSLDSTAFTVIYSDYVAWVGPVAPPLDFRKGCQINVALRAPDGFTYAVDRVDFSGYAGLPSGATATLRSDHYFQGSPAVLRPHPFTAPYDDYWYIPGVPDSEPEFNTCGALRNLNLHTDVRVSAGTSNPATTDSFVALEFATYHLVWQRCPDSR